VVLGLWWLVWTIVLAWLLYTGRSVTDDHAMRPPHPRRLLRWFEWIGDVGGVDLGDGVVEGLVLGLLLLVAAILFVLAAWLLVELAVPALALILYLVIRGMLARVANDRHGCEGHLSRAVAWGALWAVVYSAPIAGLVWVLHRLFPTRLG
jgi:hypothetical protein